MPIEFWNLMDTVVKIGLGAVIAGVVTYFITKLKHRQTVVEAAVRRRLEVIEGITAGVAEFGDAVAQYCLLTENILNAIYKSDSTIGEPPPQWLEERETLKKFLRTGGALEKPEGLLYLVSDDGTLPMGLFELQRLAGEVMYCAGQHEQDIDPLELNQKLGLFKKQAAVLMAELGKVYRSPTI